MNFIYALKFVETLSYICYEQGGFMLDDICYKHTSVKYNWMDAFENCENTIDWPPETTGKLATFYNYDKFQDIMGILRTSDVYLNGTNYWIGIKTNGSKLYWMKNRLNSLGELKSGFNFTNETNCSDEFKCGIIAMSDNQWSCADCLQNLFGSLCMYSKCSMGS